MSINDRLYDGLLKPITERFYASAQVLDALPSGDDCNHERIWQLSRLTTLEALGDLVAEVLEVPSPDWAAMRELVGAGS